MSSYMIKKLTFTSMDSNYKVALLTNIENTLLLGCKEIYNMYITVGVMFSHESPD